MSSRGPAEHHLFCVTPKVLPSLQGAHVPQLTSCQSGHDCLWGIGSYRDSSLSKMPFSVLRSIAKALTPFLGCRLSVAVTAERLWCHSGMLSKSVPGRGFRWCCYPPRLSSVDGLPGPCQSTVAPVLKNANLALSSEIFQIC